MALGRGPQRDRRLRRRRRSPARSCGRSASTRTSRPTPTSTSTRPTRSSACGRSAPTRRWCPTLVSARSRATRSANVVRHRQALPRPRRHRDRQPHRPADHQPHPRGVGAHRRAAVPRRDRRGIDSIMTAHIVVPALDPSGDPATLSKPIITGILRGELGYDGVVITDALDHAGRPRQLRRRPHPGAGAEGRRRPAADAAPGKLDVAYNAVLDAVRSGELTEDRIDQSVRRVLRLKMKRGLFGRERLRRRDEGRRPWSAPPRTRQRAQEITDATVTLVKDDADTLPLAKGGQKVLVTGWPASPPALAGRLAARGPAATAYDTGTAPSDATIAAAVAQAQASDQVVVATNKAVDAAPVSRSWSTQLLATGQAGRRGRRARTRTTSRTSPTRRPTWRRTPPPRSRWSRSPGCSSARSSRRASCRSPSRRPVTRARRCTRSATA